ncbi:MAG: phosphopantetheine-binding protein [Lewinella sp.]|jgi:hypothetical protein|uniref:phosphopantetheine-binding protein n=1 Tax=Lewinella sp. TaxID=2004506 RepID=UPI003D6C3769
MGLDSVELLVAIEECFGIEIPDIEAERIHTVNDMIEACSSRISQKPMIKCLQQHIFYKFRLALIKLGNLRDVITPSTTLINLVDHNNLESQWKFIEDELRLELPKLTTLDIYPEKDQEVKILGLTVIRRYDSVSANTIKRVIDWIISLNFHELIEIDQITGRYEVERIAIGVISDRIGVPVNEIELGHSFSYDLGVD